MSNQFRGSRNVVFIQEPEPQTVLEYYSLEAMGPYGWWGIQTAFFFAFFFFGFLALKYVKHIKR
jgi:hypothetical protein